MDAFRQFLTGEFTLAGITFENWILLAAGIFVIWIAALTLSRKANRLSRR
jgi:hypothetical protein